MNIVSAERQFCKSQAVFERMIRFVDKASDRQLRVDQVERELFNQLLLLGFELLKVFIRKAGDGNEGREVVCDGRRLKRSAAKKPKLYRSIFGVISVVRYVYATRAKQKAEYLPVDQRLGLPKGEHSYVLEDWLQRMCVQNAFSHAIGSCPAAMH